MGEDKSLLPFGEESTLTQYQLKRLQKIFKNVYISCKNKNKFDFNANFIEDIDTQNIYAPTVAFVSIFKTLKTDIFFALSVDTPFVGEMEINRVISNDESRYDAVIAKTKKGIQPLCGLYKRSLENKFLYMIESNNHKLGYLLKNINTKFVDFKNESIFTNLNTPQEYKKALLLKTTLYFRKNKTK